MPSNRQLLKWHLVNLPAVVHILIQLLGFNLWLFQRNRIWKKVMGLLLKNDWDFHLAGPLLFPSSLALKKARCSTVLCHTARSWCLWPIASIVLRPANNHLSISGWHFFPSWALRWLQSTPLLQLWEILIQNHIAEMFLTHIPHSYKPWHNKYCFKLLKFSLILQEAMDN